MVLVSYSGKEINAKIVFYGPGLCGKTTNLEYIYGSIPSKNRGKMVSMKTKTERTLFFDFLPLNLGELAGFKTRFLLYTVPGQVYYNATRKLVLKGVDAVIFVADSQRGKMEENIESFQNLKDNLREHGLSLGEVPYVIQYNKRDLPDVYPLDELERELNKENVPSFEGIATTGEGVFETFKAVSKLLLAKLSKEIGAAVVDEGGGSAAAAARAAARGGTTAPEAPLPEPVITPSEEPTVGESMEPEIPVPEVPREEPVAAEPQEPSASPLEIAGPEPQDVQTAPTEEPQKTRGLWKWLRKDGMNEEPITPDRGESDAHAPEMAPESHAPQQEPEREQPKELGVTSGLGGFSQSVTPRTEPIASPEPEKEEAVASSDLDISHDMLVSDAGVEEAAVPVREPEAHEPKPVMPFEPKPVMPVEPGPEASPSPEVEAPHAGPIEKRDGEIIVPVIVPRSAVGDRLEIRLVLHLAQECDSDDDFEADARARGII